MLDSADEARRRAQVAAAALRLVNERAAAPLVAAADRGETSVLIDVDPVDIRVAANLSGRLYDAVLIEALEKAGEATLARACRIFAALGFSLSTTPEVERREDVDRVVDPVTRIRIARLEFGFAAAQAVAVNSQLPLLQPVGLPAAHFWRARAESVRALQQSERKVLALVSEHAERGADRCRIAWRQVGDGPVKADQLLRLAEALRGRGFSVETIEDGSVLRLSW